MRKMLTVLIASGALLAVVPATALAKHNDRRHHHHHHARIHNTPAGTVVSFTNGVLTIRANDGNTSSGEVTNTTELSCEAQEPAEMQNHERGRGDNGGGGDGRGEGDNDRGDNDRGDDNGNNDNDNDNDANQMCTTGDLTPGAIVQHAKLRISSAGAVWDEVELVTQSAGSSDS